MRDERTLTAREEAELAVCPTRKTGRCIVCSCGWCLTIRGTSRSISWLGFSSSIQTAPFRVLDHVLEEVRDLLPPGLVRLECDPSDEPRSSRGGFRKEQLRLENICLGTSCVSSKQISANTAK